MKLNNDVQRAWFWACIALLAFSASPAQAHVGHGTIGSGGVVDGFLHPITGLDHLVAMVAVGLWGAQLRAPAIWLLPLTFPMVMAVGGFLGLIGVPLPAVDVGVALSGVILGLFVVSATRTPLWVPALIVGVFGLFHGHAHGTAMPMSGSPIAFGAGFILATGLLHLCGIVFGLLVRWPAGAVAVRVGGAVIAMAASWSLLTQFIDL